MREERLVHHAGRQLDLDMPAKNRKRFERQLRDAAVKEPDSDVFSSVICTQRQQHGAERAEISLVTGNDDFEGALRHGSP
ncbi:Uncharacterised protein [Collinsella intestinalis]|nr:Uncharacterised protein [Collinsella intestinalis]